MTSNLGHPVGITHTGRATLRAVSTTAVRNAHPRHQAMSPTDQPGRDREAAAGGTGAPRTVRGH